MATHDLRAKALILHSDDDVVIAKAPIPTGTVLDHEGEHLEVLCDIRPGHKIARRAHAKGETVRRYGQVIGFATQPIEKGEHVHTHNLAVGDYQREYEVGVDVRPVDYYPADQMRYFDGFKRADGRVGTRNYVAVISTVNCSASVCQLIRERFRDVPIRECVEELAHLSGIEAFEQEALVCGLAA
jgi:altronate hydrolase